ncbi:MAG: hypothetical protein Q8P76_01525 [bacterium]|nr:hypothetical protein [bacterium]
MKNQNFKKWGRLIKKVLNDCWEFRSLCEKPFDRGFIGELLVLKRLLEKYKAQLGSTRGEFFYAGSSNAEWDIKLRFNGKSILFDAKATTTPASKSDSRPKWVRQKARNFCNIKIGKDGKQHVSLFSKNNFNPNLFYVFVDVIVWLENRHANYYILSDKEAKSIFGKKYKKDHDGKIRRNDTADFHVEYNDVKNFKDRYPKFQATKLRHKKIGE